MELKIKDCVVNIVPTKQRIMDIKDASAVIDQFWAVSAVILSNIRNITPNITDRYPKHKSRSRE